VAPPPNLASGKTFTFDYVLPLAPSIIMSSLPRVTEIIGRESRPRSMGGHATPPPAQRVTISNDEVHFHITVTRRGNTTTPSAFQASYLITP
jgi:hypothetical protein